MIILLIVVVGLAWWVTTPEERIQFFKAVQKRLPSAVQVRDAAARVRAQPDPFQDVLVARTPRVLVTPALAALNGVLFFLMLVGPGALSDPETLVRWGASFGPRTTNGEWWRLVTALFVHAGMFHLLANIAGLVSVGLILERLYGHIAFLTVYFAGGLLASAMSLSGHPIAVSMGASGAIFSIYGLLIAALVAGALDRELAIPLPVLKRIAPATGVFLLYSLVAGLAGQPEMTGLLVGLLYGLALTVGVPDGKPSMRRLWGPMAAATVLAIALAVPMRGVANVKPEIERVVELEARTATAYQAAVNRFRNGQLTVDALVQLIDRTIMPELQAARSHLNAIEGVPSEHQPLVAEADKYLRLRDESWRLRAEGLRKTNMVKLRQAERTEKASLEALEKIKSIDEQ